MDRTPIYNGEDVIVDLTTGNIITDYGIGNGGANDKEKDPVVDIEIDKNVDVEFGDAVQPVGKDNCKIQTSWKRDSVLHKGLDELSVEDVLGMTFETDEEAEVFFDTYAKVIGFKLRRSDTKQRNNIVTYRKWVCSREGQRRQKVIDQSDSKRPPRALTRTGCPATFRVKYDRQSGKYVVTQFTREHNHDMVSPSKLPRTTLGSSKAQANEAHLLRMRSSHNLEDVIDQSGVIHDVGFTTKELHSSVTMECRSEGWDADTAGALAYFCGKAEHDRGFYYKYVLGSGDRLYTLFWADSRSLADYAFFGDVLVIDTTYHTNAYGRPILLLTGINHHQETIIFGSALLGDERPETYMWVLKMLLEATNQKLPVSVITDSTIAICEAVKKILPTSRHRLCCWHLQADAIKNINDKVFALEFKKCMEEICTPDEFEAAWTILIEKFRLQDNPWIQGLYAKRQQWAKAYLCQHFFGGIFGFQHSKDMRASLNHIFQVRHKFHQFLMHYDRALARLREIEAVKDSEPEHGSLVLSTGLRDLEKHGADVFTRSIFYKFREQILNEAVLFVTGKQYVEAERCWIFCLSEYTKPDVMWEVILDPNDEKMSCSCSKLESEGLPCCHMISVMKVEHMRQIPKSCIKRRWTRYARSYLESDDEPQVSDSIGQTARFAILSATCNEMNHYASQTIEGFQEARNAITKLTSRLKQLLILQSK